MVSDFNFPCVVMAVEEEGVRKGPGISHRKRKSVDDINEMFGSPQ